MQCTFCQVNKSAFELLLDLVEFGVTKGVACYKTEVCVNMSGILSQFSGKKFFIEFH